MTHDIFISYGREDSDMMQRIDQALREAGLMTWTDHGIHPGSPSWKLDIETAIQDARYIVVLFSPDSAESRWVRAELDYAEAQRKPIYPLLVRGDTTNAIPFGFTSYQWIDVRNSSSLSSGLEHLIATLKGVTTPSPLPVKMNASASNGRLRVIIPIVTALVIIGLASVILLSINNMQTPITSTATTQVTAANTGRISPTVMPTMPAFVLPDGYKMLEGDHTQIAVPANWTKMDDSSMIMNALGGTEGQPAERLELLQNVIDGLDVFAFNYLSVQSVVISVENIGYSTSNAALETRQPIYFASFDPNGTFTNAGWVDMPAGKMLYAKGDVSDKTTFVDDYVLIRGTQLYHIFLNGRIVDRERLEQIGQQIAQSFRIKE